MPASQASRMPMANRWASDMAGSGSWDLGVEKRLAADLIRFAVMTLFERSARIPDPAHPRYTAGSAATVMLDAIAKRWLYRPDDRSPPSVRTRTADGARGGRIACDARSASPAPLRPARAAAGGARLRRLRPVED